MTPKQAETYTPKQIVGLAREALTARVELSETLGCGKASHADILEHAARVAVCFAPYICVDEEAQGEPECYEGEWLYYNQTNPDFDEEGTFVGTPRNENGWVA